MKIKNTSIKPIGFGTLNVLPGKTATVPNSYSDAVAFYAKKGYVEVVKTGKDGGKTGDKNQSKTENTAGANDSAEGKAATDTAEA